MNNVTVILVKDKIDGYLYQKKEEMKYQVKDWKKSLTVVINGSLLIASTLIKLIDVLTGNRGILAHVLQRSGPRIGKYRINIENLSRIGVLAIKNAVEEADYIVIDEVGPMELQGRDFQLAIMKALENSKPVLGILHWKMRHPIIKSIKAMKGVKIYEVTRENRDKIHEVLIKEIFPCNLPQNNTLL